MKVYISGAYTDHEEGAPGAFAAAATELHHAGYETVNPLAIVERGTPYPEAMRTCIGLLYECAGVALLDGWEQSYGATTEVMVAGAFELPVHPLDWWITTGRGEPDA